MSYLSSNKAQLTLPPLSLYIHVPWCVRKCPYCDFNSHKAEAVLPEQAYVDALLQDLASELPLVQGRKLHSIFIGGGTPSLLTPAAYQHLFAGLRDQLDFSCDGPDAIEITMEANPGTFEQERFDSFRGIGINRLSIGVQSFHDECLQALGRIHSSSEAIRAMAMARKAGFDNINLDLMHGLPHQNEQMAMADLQQAIELAPNHLSWYQLTIEPNTMFWNKPPMLPEDETLWSIQEQGVALLAEHGFRQYEISAYSQNGRQSQHNLNYWRFGDFIGIGAGAHGKLTNLQTGEITRNWKTRQPGAYLNAAQLIGKEKPFQAGQQLLTKAELPLEFMMNALRLLDGVAAELYEQRTGLALDEIATTLEKVRSLELLTGDSARIQPTSQGSLFLNVLLEQFCA